MDLFLSALLFKLMFKSDGMQDVDLRKKKFFSFFIMCSVW